MFPEIDRPSIERRFWEKISPEPNSGCWLWTASVNNKGYGELRMRHNRRKVYAHRLSFFLHNGTLGPSEEVLHSCDMPCCVNPDHLRGGTHKENMQEMSARGRRTWTSGEAHPRSKISAAQATAIRHDMRATKVIAADFGLSTVHVRDIQRGRHWSSPERIVRK